MTNNTTPRCRFCRMTDMHKLSCPVVNTDRRVNITLPKTSRG